MKRSRDQILTEWLVIQCQSGKPEAIGILASVWYPLLKRYAFNMLRHEEDAMDVVQETLLNANSTVGGLQDPAAFPKWIYRILHRRCVDMIRTRKRFPAVEESIHDEAGLGRHTPDYTLAGDLQAALSHLQDSSYQVIHLYYLHGFSLKEIGEITGIPEGTVKSRLYTARQELKKRLGGYNDE